MKIETKFDIGDAVYICYYLGGNEYELRSIIVESIDIVVRSHNTDISYIGAGVGETLWQFEENVFENTPEGKEQAEKRIGELNG